MKVEIGDEWTATPVFQIKTPERKKKKKKLWMQILEKRERLSELCNPRTKKPKTQNKKESKPKSNLNLSNKKTQ